MFNRCLTCLLHVSLASLLAAGPAAGAPRPSSERATRLIVLARHAETAPDGTRDPGLSARGERRAAALVDVVRDAGITRVVTSGLRRTRETGKPAAEHFGVELIAVPVTRDGGIAGHVRAVADTVRATTGGSVLVVGHSNTVPRIIGALGGPRLDDIDEHDHSGLFVLSLEPDGTASLVRSRYGDGD